jgi:hypothetical protein
MKTILKIFAIVIAIGAIGQVAFSAITVKKALAGQPHPTEPGI